MKYKIDNNKITITGGFENQSIIEIPDDIDGYPVTCIESYAFSERLDITEVILPSTIITIEAHAFYNCKHLKNLWLYDEIKEIYDGAFKNCYDLSVINLKCNNGREGCIRNILSDNIQEVSLFITYNTGDKSRVFFPTFEDDYVENTPARIFQAVSFGTGGAYRQCMQLGNLDYREFDRLFSRSVREDRFMAPLMNSVYRLKYPYKLYNSAAETYKNFIRENNFDSAKILIENEMTDEMSLLCENELITEDHIDEIIEYSRIREKIDILGMLINYKSKNFKIKKKSFEL